MPPQKPAIIGYDPNTGKAVKGYDPNTGLVVFAEADKPATEQPQQSSAGARFAGNLIEGLNPINVVKGAYQAVRHPYDTFIAPAAERLPKVMPAVREGRFTDAANEVAGSIPLIGPAAADISAQQQAGDWAGGFGKLTALIAGPKLMKGAAQGLKGAAVMGSAPVMNASAAVRALALENSAMPGLLKSGASRVGKRIAATGERIDDALAQDPGAPVSVRNMAYAPKAFDEIQTRIKSGPGLAAARRVQSDLRGNVKLQPPMAEGANSISRGSYRATTGRTDPASIMERAIADNAMREIGRVVPDAAPHTSRMIDLQKVASAHASPSPHAPPGMAPTLAARIALAAAQRGIGPVAQGMYNVGRAGSAVPLEAIRAAMLAELLKHSGGENR